MLGQPFMPWQTLVSDTAGEVDESGEGFAYQIVDVVVPRRGGKTMLAIATCIQRATMRPLGRSWYTSQTRQDAADKFAEDWVPLIEQSPMRPQLYIRKANGSERLTIRKTKSTVGLFPPTRKGLHGKDADTVFVDEAWAFDLAQGKDIENGAQPSSVTRPWRQLWRISAAGDEKSSYLDQIMATGRELVESGRPSRRAYFEYSAPVAEGQEVDIYDRRLWWATHPALGHTITEAALAADAETMDPVDFARHYLCIPAKQAHVHVIPSASWRACGAPGARSDQTPTFALDVTPERSGASIAAASRLHDGKVLLECIDQRPGTDWLVERVVELDQRWRPSAVVIDPTSPAGSFIAPLELAGVKVEQPTARQVAQACGALFDAVVAGTVRHLDQGPLNGALAGARKRQVGDAWAWSRRSSSVDITPLVAVTLARWGLENAADYQCGFYRLDDFLPDEE